VKAIEAAHHSVISQKKPTPDAAVSMIEKELRQEKRNIGVGKLRIQLIFTDQLFLSSGQFEFPHFDLVESPLPISSPIADVLEQKLICDVITEGVESVSPLSLREVSLIRQMNMYFPIYNSFQTEADLK
jgi:hypothetical protein